MRALWVMMGLFIGAGGSAQAAKQVHRPVKTDPVFEAAKAAASENLKDPSSAQFRKLRKVIGENGEVRVCGEVNAKNSYGGYVGFKLFEYYSKSNDAAVSTFDASSPEEAKAERDFFKDCLSSIIVTQ